MEIITDYPPNYDKIAEVFPIKNRPGVIFTYGDTLYCPNGVDVPGHLMAHEQTHTKQQGKNVEGWWDRYLTDSEFRLNQEVEAYHNQYEYLRDNHNRKDRRFVLNQICKDLASPIYGSLVTKEQAKELIVSGL